MRIAIECSYGTSTRSCLGGWAELMNESERTVPNTTNRPSRPRNAAPRNILPYPAVDRNPARKMLALTLALTHGWSIDLRAATGSSSPWLVKAACSADEVGVLSTDIYHLPLTASQLVKAFDPRNDADAFVVGTPLVKWVCARQTCGRLFEPDTTLWEAARLTGSPLSAKLSQELDAATPGLQAWLTALTSASGRRVLDADVYLTSAAAHASTSASLGWHIEYAPQTHMPSPHTNATR